MKTLAKTLLLLGLGLVLVAPDLAEARAGSGRSSFGSRGGRTYQAPPMARPMERSTTPRPAPQPTRPSASTAQPQTPGVQPMGFASRHPFMTSFAGGLLGASLFNMLFGHSALGMGMSPMGAGLGGLLQILFFGGLIYMAFRWMRGRRSGGMNPFQSFGQSGFSAPQSEGDAPYIQMPSADERSLAITQEDKGTFENLLNQIQLSWGESDMTRLRQYLTPEMYAYFSETLSANQSRGEVNKIANVVFHSCDIIEAWSEGTLDYATVRLRWRAIDYMARLGKQPSDSDYIASGDAQTPTEAEEMWTFIRAKSGGQWLLSAIQQMA